MAVIKLWGLRTLSFRQRLRATGYRLYTSSEVTGHRRRHTDIQLTDEYKTSSLPKTSCKRYYLILDKPNRATEDKF